MRNENINKNANNKLATFSIYRKLLIEEGRLHGLKLLKYATATSYPVFFSIVPIFTLFFFVTSNLSISVQQYIVEVTGIMPETVASIFSELLDNTIKTSKSVAWLVLIFSLVTASNGITILLDNLNEIYEADSISVSQQLKQIKRMSKGNKKELAIEILRLVSIAVKPMLITVILIAVMTFGIGLTSLWKTMIFLLDSHIPSLRSMVQGIGVSRYTIMFAVLFITLSFIYKFLPSRKLELKHQFVGAFVSTLGYAIVMFGTEIYFNHFDFSRYGIFSSAIIMLLWMNLSFIPFYFGALFNVAHMKLETAMAAKR